MVSGLNNNMLHMYKGSSQVDWKFSWGEYIYTYSAKPGHIILLVNNLM